MNHLIVFIHLLACIALIAIVLLQTGKGAEMGAAFGGATQTLFGGSGGSSFMSKLTTGAAIVFMITSLLLSYLYRPEFQRGRSVMTNIPAAEQPQAKPPAKPQPMIPEARPVQPSAAVPAVPEATQKAGQTAQPQTNANAPAAGEQPQQGQGNREQAPVQKK